jgi:hypothetical protein
MREGEFRVVCKFHPVLEAFAFFLDAGATNLD